MSEGNDIGLGGVRYGTTVIGGTPFEWGARTYVMGVVNVTPDSFSGDGVGSDVEAAVRLALRFQESGVDLLDVGGMSTRPPSVYPGARPVSEAEETSRVIPVIDRLASRLTVPISVDTYRAGVADRALQAGVAMVNDVWGLSGDPRMAAVVSGAGVPVVLMHNQDHTRYDDLVPDVVRSLGRSVDAAVEAGVDRGNIIADPGMGFGKTAEQNLEILRRLGELRRLERPIMVGMSRKSTIGLVLDLPAHERMEGTAATVALSIAGGADIVRVHDVKEMVRVARMSDAIVRGWNPG